MAAIVVVYLALAVVALVIAARSDVVLLAIAVGAAGYAMSKPLPDSEIEVGQLPGYVLTPALVTSIMLGALLAPDGRGLSLAAIVGALCGGNRLRAAGV